MKILAQEYDKMLKLTALIFTNALMRLSGFKPGIIRIEYPEIFTQETDRGIMDFPVLSIENFYIIFEFHKTPLTTRLLLRNFQYLADFRSRVKHPVALHIVSLDHQKRSVRSVKITPEWSFTPGFTFLIDFDGDKILSNIKNKIKSNIPLSEDDAYFLAVLPFTKHKKGTVELVVELCYWINEVEIPEEFKYIIKMSQILWVNVLIKDEKLSNKLIDVIKMKSTFIEEYERNLIESAVESATNDKANEIAANLEKMGLTHDEILKATGIDISKK